jgi:hypothetical protein
VTAAAAVKAAAAVEPSTAVKASTKARLPASGEAPGDSSMIKAAECAGVRSRLAMWRLKSMLATGESSGLSAMKSASSMKSAGAIELVAICEHSAVGYVAVVVENNAVMMPIVSPVVPSPPEPAKEADSKAEAKRNPRPGQE